MSEPFLDTNIFLRHLTGQPPEQAARATAYFQEIEQGHIRVVTIDMIIFEVVYTLQRTYRLSKREVQSAILPLIELPGIALSGKRQLREAFDLYVNLNLPFADAWYIATMKKMDVKTIISFDSDFDKIPEIVRIEP